MADEKVDIAAGITADLLAEDQASAPSVDNSPATPAPADTTKATESAPATPAPEVPASTPQPLALQDNALVVDPADGQQKTWGEIKAERLRQADYTRKTMSLADERRALESEKARLQAEYNAALAAVAAQKAAAEAVDLPEDDPYAKRIKAIEAQNAALAAQQALANQHLEQQQIAAARSRLDADEARAAELYKLGERDKTIVGQELLRRMQVGDPLATYDAVAREYHAWKQQEIAAAKEEALREYKEKHRVGAPAAAAAVPSPGVAQEQLRPGTRGFADAMREEIAALMR